MRFLTWMKKEVSNGDGKNKKQSQLRTVYFDYENEWRIKVSSNDLALDEKYLEKELISPKEEEIKQALGPEAMEYLRDDFFVANYSCGTTIQREELPAQILEQLSK